jgi:putative nucleotidyltransferase with HDIG domain
MNLSARGQLFVWTVSAVGLLVLAECIASVLIDPVRSEWLILAGLTLLSGSFTIKIPALGARFSVSETFVFTSVLLFGTSAGTITLALDALIAALGSSSRREPLRIIFNLSAATLSIWVASRVFYAVAGIHPLIDDPSVKLPEFLWPLVLLTITYFLLNSGLVAIAIAFERNASWFAVWQRSFLWLGVSYFTGASVAALLVSYTRTVDLMALGIIVPLLIISYLTFKISLGRIEDATRHVEQVDRLYMSTIETLAMAIDAKDQVTHGHIRRVQRFALGLAVELGVRDESQVKALEAAALLHDTGKLVVPEHILNKPGRLTPGEFEKMKLHAAAGAEILSAIHFPYPVVPIVRHHHEAWDGSGYPDGLKGTQIPLGARILQVVDCFDALTSDRPYRGRLTDEDALAVLMQRRGTMYDPLVVDTFVAVKEKLETAATHADSRFEAVLETRVPKRSVAIELEHRLEYAVAQCPTFLHQARLVARSLLDATGAQLTVLFVKDYARDELVSVLALSRRNVALSAVAMPIGGRISGWVAANGRAILNAEAALDLPRESGELALTRCLSVPFGHGSETSAVMSLYLDDARGFSDHDLRVVEAGISALDSTLLERFAQAMSQVASSEKAYRPTVH